MALDDRLTLPRRASAMSAGLSAEQRPAHRARRAEMRLFYGMKTASPGVKGGLVGTAGSGDPLVVDSSGFDSNAYLQDLVQNSTLGELMQKGAELAADVSNLQGSRHSLVYNHHHQLFEAGDTISRLNSRTPQLLGIMANLQQSFSEISRLVDDIVVEQTKSEEESKWDQVVKRTRLMIRAEESTEAIKEQMERVKSQAESMPENQDVQSALWECQKAFQEM